MSHALQLPVYMALFPQYLYAFIVRVSQYADDDTTPAETAKCKQNWSALVYNKPLSTPAAWDHSDEWQRVPAIPTSSVHPSSPWPWYLHRSTRSFHMQEHVQRTVSSCVAALRQQLRIRQSLPAVTVQTLLVALLHSCLQQWYAAWSVSQRVS